MIQKFYHMTQECDKHLLSMIHLTCDFRNCALSYFVMADNLTITTGMIFCETGCFRSIA